MTAEAGRRRPLVVLHCRSSDARYGPEQSLDQVFPALRDEAMKNQVATGPHSPPQFRVIGPLRNIDAWYAAFGVREGATLYLAPASRVQVW